MHTGLRGSLASTMTSLHLFKRKHHFNDKDIYNNYNLCLHILSVSLCKMLNLSVVKIYFFAIHHRYQIIITFINIIMLYKVKTDPSTVVLSLSFGPFFCCSEKQRTFKKALNPGDATLVSFLLAPSLPTIHALNTLFGLVHPHPHLVLCCFFPSSFNPCPHTSAHPWTSENWDTCGQSCSSEKKQENFVNFNYIGVISLALF